MINDQLIVRWFGTLAYHETWLAMQQYTRTRDEKSFDEAWLVEHYPVFTQGQNGKAQHVLNAGDIPIVQTDRGGQVTYHGPGQLMVYTLIDLQRKQFTIRDIVCSLEKTVIDFLHTYHIDSVAKRDAPGVYVADKKICSIGLRIRRGCVYHGIAFNIKMDLAPFSQINPCGFPGLKMTQLHELNVDLNPFETGKQLIPFLMSHLGYNSFQLVDDNQKSFAFLSLQNESNQWNPKQQMSN